MKKADLLKKLRKAGCELVRQGGAHEIWRNPHTGKIEPIPRHREINERLAQKILKSLTAK